MLDRAKLDNFYAKVQSQIEEQRQNDTKPKDPFADFMAKSGDSQESKITRILELPFRSNFKFDFDLENAMNKILADACARFRWVFYIYFYRWR